MVKGKVDVCNLPCTSGNQPASLNVYWLYTVGSGSSHKDLAYDFLRFAVNAANDKKLTLEGGIGCRMSTWYDEEVNKTIPYYHKLAGLHQHAKSLPQRTDWVQIAKIIDQTISNALKTTIPSSALLREAQTNIDELKNKDYDNTL
jgi:multiple sugar transport system substrate-binding protein